MRQLFVLVWLAFTISAACSADYDLKVDAQTVDGRLLTSASFRVPLSKCQAYLYLLDYDASAGIPGVASSKTTRLGPQKALVELELEEKILWMPLKLNSVLEFEETPGVGTDFVQVRGDIPDYRGSWRLEPDASGVVYRYRASARPAMVLPSFIIRYFVLNSLNERFAAIARIAVERAKHLSCT